MEKRIKIYIGIIAALSIFLVYALFFVKDETAVDMPSYPVQKKLKPGEPVPSEDSSAPKYKPKQIPDDVLKGSKENDYYYYIFINPNRKVVYYSYDLKSKTPETSGIMYTKIKNALETQLYYGNYKDYSESISGMKLYRKNILKDDEFAGKTIESGGNKNDKALLEKSTKINAVTEFIDNCAKTMCIINPAANEYVIIDKRDINDAIQTLKEYEKW